MGKCDAKSLFSRSTSTRFQDAVARGRLALHACLKTLLTREFASLLYSSTYYASR